MKKKLLLTAAVVLFASALVLLGLNITGLFDDTAERSRKPPASQSVRPPDDLVACPGVYPPVYVEDGLDCPHQEPHARGPVLTAHGEVLIPR